MATTNPNKMITQHSAQSSKMNDGTDTDSCCPCKRQYMQRRQRSYKSPKFFIFFQVEGTFGNSWPRPC